MAFSFMISSQFASFGLQNQRKTRAAFVSLAFILLAKFKWINIGATGGKFKIFNDAFWIV